jgi:hypothetical protein
LLLFGRNAEMPRRGTIFTPATVRIVRHLAQEGKSAAEIAEVIGSTAASVRVKCCQLKIRLRRRSGSLSERRRRPTRGEKLDIYLDPAIYAGLKRKADALHRSVVDLAEKLLEAVVMSDIYDAVLDERE